MCFPIVSATTMAGVFGPGAAAFTALDAIGIGSTLISAVGSFTQASAAKDQAAYQAAVAQNNQVIAERQAKDIEKRGELEARQQKLRGKQLEGRQLVSLAGQGVDVTEGTSVDLLAETAELSALDEAAIRSDAGRKAHSARVQAMNFQAQSGLFKTQAQAQSPILAAGSTALSGFGAVAEKWYNRGTRT